MPNWHNSSVLKGSIEHNSSFKFAVGHISNPCPMVWIAHERKPNKKKLVRRVVEAILAVFRNYGEKKIKF